MKSILIILLLSCTLLVADVVLYDEPYSSDLENGNVSVSVTVLQGSEDIENAFFYYRAIGKTSYNMIAANIDISNDSDYIAELPLNVYTETGLEFYFEAETKQSIRVSLPKFFPAEHPYQVGIEAETTDNGFVVLSPGTEHDAEDDYVYSVSYFAIQDEVDLETMKVIFDGRDVTSMATITGSMMVLKLENVKQGMHSAELRVRTENGTLLLSGKHTTQVSSDKQMFELPFPLNGDATFRSNVYSSTTDDGASITEGDNDATFNMNLYSRSENAHRKGFWYDFRGNFYRDSKQNKFTQRNNRATLDLEIPFLRFIMGDYSPNYSEFNMNNSNVYGVHAILNYYFLSVMFSTGENRRAIENENTNHGTFARDMTSLRLELGTDKSKHTSFLGGLHFSTTRDDVESIKQASYSIVDSAQYVFPEDNFVIGADFKITLPEQRSSLGGEIAFALYNSNITDGAFTLEEMEERFGITGFDVSSFHLELDPEQYEDIFIINENMQPYKPNMANVAWKAYLRPYLLHNNINIEYAEIGSGYRSLSSNSLQSDVSRLIITDQINILNFAMLSAGYNKNEDNLSEQKATTTTFQRYYGQVVLQHKDVTSVSFSYDTSNNLGVNEETEVDEFEQQSVNMGVSANYFVKAMPVAPTRFNITYANSKSTDELSDSYEVLLNSINFTMMNKFNTIPLTTKVYYGWAASENETDLYGLNENGSNSFGMRGEYAFLNGKLTPYADFKLVMLSGDEDQSFNYVNVGTKYSPWANTKIATNVRLKSYANSSSKEDDDYSQLNWNFYISQRF